MPATSIINSTSWGLLPLARRSVVERTDPLLRTAPRVGPRSLACNRRMYNDFSPPCP